MLLPAVRRIQGQDTSSSSSLNESAASQECHVLDMGTGMGILAMFAAQAGAESVTAAELHPELGMIHEDSENIIVIITFLDLLITAAIISLSSLFRLMTTFFGYDFQYHHVIVDKILANTARKNIAANGLSSTISVIDRDIGLLGILFICSFGSYLLLSLFVSFVFIFILIRLFLITIGIIIVIIFDNQSAEKRSDDED